MITFLITMWNFILSLWPILGIVIALILGIFVIYLAYHNGYGPL